MVKHDLPKVATLGEMVLEDQLGPQGDMPSELLPPKKRVLATSSKVKQARGGGEERAGSFKGVPMTLTSTDGFARTP